MLVMLKSRKEKQHSGNGLLNFAFPYVELVEIEV